MDHLSDGVVLITGATGSLGAAVVREFAQTTARLALVSTSADKLEQLAAGLSVPPERVMTAAGDLTRETEVAVVIERVAARFGKIDALLNTVGGWRGGVPVAELTAEEWDRTLNLNLRSAFLLSRAVLPGMLERGWGRIVHVSSKAASDPRTKQAAYAVAKMAVVTLTTAIAAEVKGSGVTANVILPSVIDTPENRATLSKSDPAKWVPPERIAALMGFLCSEEGASINGAAIPIYGAV